MVSTSIGPAIGRGAAFGISLSKILNPVGLRLNDTNKVKEIVILAVYRPLLS